MTQRGAVCKVRGSALEPWGMPLARGFRLVEELVSQRASTCTASDTPPQRAKREWSVRHEEVAVEALSRNEDVVMIYNFQLNETGGTTMPSPLPGPDWAREWLGEHCFTRVVRLRAGRLDLDDDSLAHVAQLRQLRLLHNDLWSAGPILVWPEWSYPNKPAVAGDDPITDAGLAHLSDLTHLESLVLVGTVVADDGLRHLTGLQRLRRLKISSPHITDRGIAHLRKLGNLSQLCLVGTSISEAGVVELRSGLPNCKIVGPAGLQEHEKDRCGIHMR